MVSMELIYLAIPLASLAGAVIAGFFGKQIMGSLGWMDAIPVQIIIRLAASERR